MEYLFCCQDAGEIYFASRMLFTCTEQKKTAKLWACCDLKKKKKKVALQWTYSTLHANTIREEDPVFPAML